MRYKAKVLARFPDARTVTLETWPWCEPRYVAVVTGHPTGSDEDGWDYSKRVRLDIHVPDGRTQQLATAAWQSAYFWMVRNPEVEAEDAA